MAAAAAEAERIAVEAERIAVAKRATAAGKSVPEWYVEPNSWMHNSAYRWRGFTNSEQQYPTPHYCHMMCDREKSSKNCVGFAYSNKGHGCWMLNKKKYTILPIITYLRSMILIIIYIYVE